MRGEATSVGPAGHQERAQGPGGLVKSIAFTKLDDECPHRPMARRQTFGPVRRRDCSVEIEVNSIRSNGDSIDGLEKHRTPAHPQRSSDKSEIRSWRVVAAVEVVVAAVAVLLDLGIPTLVLLAMAVLSLTVRRHGPSTLGLRMPAQPGRMAAEVLGLSLLCRCWSWLCLSRSWSI